MGFLDGLTNRMGIAGELLQFFLNHKWWWLTPMILVLLIRPCDDGGRGNWDRRLRTGDG